jgi:hypothetical protein
MLSTTHDYITKKTIIIPIKKNLFDTNKDISPKSEYSLNTNFFDPSNSSLPNEFMLKLQMRMDKHTKTIYEDMNNDNLDKE